MYMRFTWHAGKRQKNPIVHPGITFEMAQEVFDDPNQVVLENYFFQDEREQRLQIIGMTRQLLLLLVVYVEHLEREEEIIHIISARKASKYERKIYETAASKA